MVAFVYDAAFNVGITVCYGYVIYRALYNPALLWHPVAPAQWRVMVCAAVLFAFLGLIARGLEVAHTFWPSFDLSWWRASYPRTHLIPLLSAFAWFITYQVLTALFGGLPHMTSEPMPIIRINAMGTIMTWNEAAEAMLGWRAEDVRGHELAEILVPERLRAAHRAGLERLRHGEPSLVLDRPFHTTALRRAGEESIQEIPVEVIITQVGHPQHREYIGLVRLL